MTETPSDEQPERRLLVQDGDRLEDVEIKHERIRELLGRVGADALLIQEPSNIAWLSSGADLFQTSREHVATSVFVTPEARLFATNSVDSSQIFEREAFGLGFQLKQREWFQPHADLVADLVRSRKVISDTGLSGTRAAPKLIQALRAPLTDLETKRLRTLSRIAVHAVEATGHQIRRGMTEAEVAGQVSHRLLKRTVAVAKLQVCADGRNERFRHWTFGENPIEQFAVVSCVARRWGLHVGVTRTISVDRIPERLINGYQQALMVHATGLFFARHQEELSSVWAKVQRIYEKFGMENEWQLADQGSTIGYDPLGHQIGPGATETIEAPTAVFWHPSVGPAMLGDTVLCHTSHNERITTSSSWPEVPVMVKGREVNCPGILRTGGTQQKEPNHAAGVDEDGEPEDSYEVLDHPSGESEPDRVDSVWEMRIPS